ncbi:hypothetical protein PVAND_017137 [Polypedilum vanderplanki]|uniref:Leucine rich repeat protein n=1 Tax=Polypedilum vanderplanki TaxID=319348 RepID=A0A9J6BHF9_POLVA|nr:hypothetical protein PVAND_017137 [Polypedilum vanderplanki]
MTEINCKFERIFSNYRCLIENQKIHKNLITINGKHLTGKTNNQVNQIYLTECDFEEFPEKLQKIFSNVESLRIWKCKLDKINRKHIKNWKKLTHIYVENCELRKLEGDTFKDLKELKFISFDGNKLEEIEPKTFDGLEKLEWLNLRRNLNIDMRFDIDDERSNSLNEIKKEIKMKCIKKNSNFEEPGRKRKMFKKFCYCSRD